MYAIAMHKSRKRDQKTLNELRLLCKLNQTLTCKKRWTKTNRLTENALYDIEILVAFRLFCNAVTRSAHAKQTVKIAAIYRLFLK